MDIVEAECNIDSDCADIENSLCTVSGKCECLEGFLSTYDVDNPTKVWNWFSFVDLVLFRSGNFFVLCQQ